MIRRICFALVAAAALRGQQEASPEAAQLLVPHAGEQRLSCQIHPLAPALTYRLVYSVGYSIKIPVEQLLAGARTLEIVTRVTPAGGGGKPLVLRDEQTLPGEAGEQDNDASKFDAEIAGSFYAGEGAYRIELAAASGARVCRKQWDVEVKPRKGASPALGPGQVTSWSGMALPRLGQRAGGVTIFLHAADENRNAILLQVVGAVLDSLPFQRVQVVAFSLAQHKELVREEVSGRKEFERLADSLMAYNPGTVSYDVLQDPAGHRDFLWKLLAKEGLRTPPDDLVVFAGFQSLDDSRVFAPPGCAGGKTAYAYLEFALPAGRRARTYGDPRRSLSRRGIPLPQPVMPDAIARVMRACSGKVFPIYSSADLAEALQKLH
ncbi:MAG: hypothetical protein ACM336_20380 [Acidobacteriota bacterium]